MPRLVRRRPLMERVKAMLNPMDFLLWLSEEIETRDWDSKLVGTQLGLAMNFAFLLARANSGGSRAADPVFDEGGTSGWFSFFVGTLLWLLIGCSVINAFYTMYRSRHYRLFEADVEKPPSTPSAQRVRVQSSPVSSSPLRFLTDMMSFESAESRAHPDRTRDVWQLSVWDPLPISLRIFCLFSPGHVLVYMMFLPLVPLDARPSVTVFNCIVLQIILSVQLVLFQSRFSQQNKDTSVIQKEVMHEYDTKFVHPRLYPTVRDAGTQLSMDDDNEAEFVEVGTRTVQLRRGFETRPNPNYARHINPDVTGSSHMNKVMAPGLFTPPVASRQSAPFGSELRSRQLTSKPARKSTPGPTPLSQATTRSVATSSTNTGDGGYLGVYNHPSSPLKKAPSLGDLQFRSPRNNGEMARIEQYQSQQGDRSSSPLKSSRKSTGTSAALNPQPSRAWGRPQQQSYERYPSMFQ
ncbi:Uu.00g017470.m01.CDS01 [Anthostomella pinea]|uniref:Uu.00g017470.m01.CDS01 n=1 Tax=Anthostomella pinea TaxID=933095 RepID=A0AAI8VYX1_9PEZI|nr:Uu.00g017470.m01.CDS01 [Anthostomella pinea]